MSHYMQHINIKVKIALIITIILWSSAFISIRIGLEAYTPGPLALLRYLVASLCMLFFYLRLKKRSTLTFLDYGRAITCGILGFGVYNVALNMGEVTTNAAISSFIISQVPLITVLCASYFLKEKLSLTNKLGLLISFIGICVILSSQYSGATFNYGLIDVIIATLAMSLYNILQKPLLQRMSAIEFTSIAMWSGTAMMLIFTPDLMHEIQQAPIWITINVIYMGIFPAAIAYFLWSYALSKVPTCYAAFYFYCIPLITTMMSIALLGETLSTIGFLGGLIALFGVVIAQRKNKTEKEQKSQTPLTTTQVSMAKEPS
ncbi:DMT family transporter [Piscirickettsia salmonis]|uniref:DMT family transporter n=2 Tax=Piscirickettsia salmonis TaxID=1238 RepID=UPI0012B7B96E|nr:DMT family transporter [Piscirickettsia salmonis]